MSSVGPMLWKTARLTVRSLSRLAAKGSETAYSSNRRLCDRSGQFDDASADPGLMSSHADNGQYIRRVVLPRVVRSTSCTSSLWPTTASAPRRPRPRAPRVPVLRVRSGVPGRVGGLPDALEGPAALPELRVERGRHLRPADRRPLRQAARHRHRDPAVRPQRLQQANMESRSSSSSAPSTLTRSSPKTSSCSGRRRRRPPAPARPAGPRAAPGGRPWPPPRSPARSRARRRARRSRRSRRGLGLRRAYLPQVERPQRRVALARQDQRQRDGAVEQVGAAVLAGPLGRARDVEHVVEHLEREPDPAAEAPEHGDRRRPLERPSSQAAWNSRAVLRSQRCS